MVARQGLHVGLLLSLLLGALVALTGSGLRDAGAICPTPRAQPGGRVPPGLRNPFDPPPPPDEPADPPPTPTDPPPVTGGGPNGPTTPTPNGPVTPPGSEPPPFSGPTGPRTRPARGLDALDDSSWELWWGLNRADVMPRVQRQDAKPDGTYARTLPPELRGAMDAVIESLADTDDSVVQAATGALACTVTSYRVLDTLVGLRKVAKGSDLFARDLAHLALGMRRDPELAEEMRAVLRNKHEEVVSRGFAALALIQLNEPKSMADVHAAVADLHEGDLAGAVLIALGRTRDPQHLPMLREAVARKGGSAVRLRRVRGDALTAMGILGDASAVSTLAPLLKDKENSIARTAALALGGLKGSAEAVKALKDDGLTSEDAFVRAYSAISLGRLGDPSALPAVARLTLAEDSAVQPFALLSVGLFHQSTGAPLLEAPLSEDPRTGRFNASALSAGLLGATDHRQRLLDALGDTRTTSAPACSAMGLGLMPAKEALLLLRRRFWFDGARARPGHDQALALLDPAVQSNWIKEELKRVKRSNAKQALVEALALCGGPAEGATLTELFQSTPKGDGGLRIALINATSAIVNDRDVSYPRSLLHHTYYLQPNIVLAHLAFLP
jgi:HEAT repeat protein